MRPTVVETANGASTAPKRLRLATGLVWHRVVRARKQSMPKFPTGKIGLHVPRNVVEVKHSAFVGF